MNELATIDQNSLALATEMAKSDLLPPHLKGKPANVLLLLGLAHELGISPMMTFNKVAIINGKPAMSSELMLALLNRSGRIRGTVLHRWIGAENTPGRGCIASAVCAVTGNTVEGQPVTLALAQASGWTRNPLWKSMPDVMLRHRATAWMIRQYWPDVLMGLPEENEVRDVEADGVTNAERPQSARDRLRAMREAQGTVRDVTPPQSEPEAPQEVPDDTQALLELLDAVANCTDPVELTSLVGNAQAMEGQPRKAARIAIAARAEALGFVWSANEGEFVDAEGGAA